MKPFKVAVSLANWLLRLALAAYLIFTYWNSFTAFQLELTSFWYAAIYVVFAALLIIGGFIPEQALTVISGLIIMLLSVVLIFITYITFYSTLQYLLPATVGFYFFCKGNNK